jgi:hypothetical protein
MISFSVTGRRIGIAQGGTNATAMLSAASRSFDTARRERLR